MSNKNDQKITDFDEVVEDIKKSVYKSVLKSLRSKNRDKTQSIVEDIADPNNIAQVDPDILPPKKFNVVNKNEKGAYKLKNFIVNRKAKLNRS